MKTFYSLYENISTEEDAIALKLLETRSIMSYCKAVVDRKPSYTRKKYMIAKFIVENEVEVQRVWYAYIKGGFKESQHEQGRNFSIIG